MQFNIIFKTIFEYIHKKFCFVHTNTFCEYRKKLRASPRVHLVLYVHTHGLLVCNNDISISINNITVNVSTTDTKLEPV